MHKIGADDIQMKELMEEIINLEKIISDLNKEIVVLKNEIDVLKYGKHALKKSKTLNDDELKEYSGSVINLKLIHLKQLSKRDLMEILLIREALLYNKINEFDSCLKHNDRVVFKNLRNEISRTKEYLLSKDQSYFELQVSKKDFQVLKKKYNALKVRLNELRFFKNS